MSVITGKRKRADAHSKECMICVESKPVYRNFPDFTTCSHEPDVCSSCVAEQTVTILQSSRWQGWSACRCLQCDIFIPTEELQAALPRALVKEMKEMMGRAVDSAQESWRWCLAAGCGHGSLHDSKKEMIRCKKCDYKMCFKHQVPWHVGYTCQEYDMSHPQAAITKTSEELISKMSKPCPGCGIAVQKAGGCNFMACESIHLQLLYFRTLKVYRQQMWNYLALGHWQGFETRSYSACCASSGRSISSPASIHASPVSPSKSSPNPSTTNRTNRWYVSRRYALSCRQRSRFWALDYQG